MRGESEWSAERVRQLRGDETRAAFAARLGVSPLTVYRWELPDGAPEARRPRGAIKKRLEALVRGELAAMTPAASAPEPTSTGLDDAEQAELAPLLARLERGELDTAENALVLSLASGRLHSLASRALATQALARAQLWSRADTRAAFTTLLPFLAEADAGRLPAAVACEVHVTAALVFSSLDGRIFDAGKTNAHIARAERLVGPERRAVVRFLVWYAQVFAAYSLNDTALLEVVLARADEVETELDSPLLALLAEELRAFAAYVNGRPAQAERHAAEVVRIARERGFHHVLVRTLSQATRKLSDDGTPPDEVLAMLAGIESIARLGRLAPGWHSIFVPYAESEATLRSGRLDASEDAVREHLRISEELRWAPGSAPLMLARLLLLRGRQDEIRAMAERAATMRTAVFAEVSRLVALATLELAEAVEGTDPVAAIERFEEHARQAEAAGAWSYLRRNTAFAGATLAAFRGTDAQFARGLLEVERSLDAAPAAWVSTALDGLRAVHATRRGRLREALVLAERAIEGFEKAGDRTHGALLRHLRGQVLVELGEPAGPDALRDAERELERLGVVPPRIARETTTSTPPAAAAASDDLAGLARALTRLSARGLTPLAVQRELLAVAAELFPGAALSLDELDSRGVPTRIGAVGEPAGEPAWAEVGDGAGRRYRLGIGGGLAPAARPLLEGLASGASLALEVATLRGIADVSAHPVADSEVPDLPGFISASPQMRRLRADLARLSRSRSTVIVTGESGAGKEVVARAIHDLSVRAGKPYVAFNCAAIPRELFEGQLFGYRKGSFTGAASDHPGVIRAASGGTLFLDEIGELPLDVQPKLLRFLENGEIFPLGERAPVRVDVRVIAATFRDLDQLVREKRFREDLFFRLQVVPLRVPPLRERPEDLVALARHFVRAFTPEGREPPVLSQGAVAALLAHGWPGNVRELRNVVERTLAFEPLPAVLGAEHLRLG